MGMNFCQMTPCTRYSRLQPEESPVLNIPYNYLLELEYEGGVVADDHDEAEEDIEEIEGDPALDQLVTALMTKNLTMKMMMNQKTQNSSKIYLR